MDPDRLQMNVGVRQDDSRASLGYHRLFLLLDEWSGMGDVLALAKLGSIIRSEYLTNKSTADLQGALMESITVSLLSLGPNSHTRPMMTTAATANFFHLKEIRPSLSSLASTRL